MLKPCKDCLKYPACASRTVIRCSDFHDYLVYHYRQMKKQRKEFLKVSHLDIPDQNYAWDQAWDIIKETFPRLNSLYRGVAKYTRYGGSDEPFPTMSDKQMHTSTRM